MRQITLLIIVAACTCSSFAQSVTLNVSGIRNLKGYIQVSVFENQKQFDEEEPVRIFFFDKNDVTNGCKSITINLKPGDYAVAVLDDEDGSKDMTYRLGIYPREGVGFSNYRLSGMSKPEFSDFDFTLGQGNTDVVVEMKYF